MEIFQDWGELSGGLHFLGRYAHILFGITWIGLLYFFNFVQVPSYAEMEAAARTEALRKVTWRALWWFRWAALLTFLTGVLMLGIGGSDYKLSLPQGTSIYWGAILGTLMFLNVWGIIWRMQKIAIGSAAAVAAGGEADPRAPEAAKRAARASRVNTLFSIPMLFFMVFTSHFSFRFDEVTGGSAWAAWIIYAVLVIFIELSALGLIGGLDSPFNKVAFDSHRYTIAVGFLLLLILYIVGFEAIIGTP